MIEQECCISIALLTWNCEEILQNRRQAQCKSKYEVLKILLYAKICRGQMNGEIWDYVWFEWCNSQEHKTAEFALGRVGK